MNISVIMTITYRFHSANLFADLIKSLDATNQRDSVGIKFVHLMSFVQYSQWYAQV